MASRPTARAAMQLANKLHVRRLSITGPATYPSATLTETRINSVGNDNASPLSSIKRPHASNSNSSSSNNNADIAGSETTAGPAVVRQFNTSRSLKAVKDSSTIDFAYFPDIDRADIPKEQPFSVPLLLSTMYEGVNARAMHEEESESTLRPLIELVSASGTHISMPSAMSEVHDNNAVEFEGIASSATSDSASQQDGAVAQVNEIRQFFNDVLDDVLGPKRT